MVFIINLNDKYCVDHTVCGRTRPWSLHWPTSARRLPPLQQNKNQKIQMTVVRQKSIQQYVKHVIQTTARTSRFHMEYRNNIPSVSSSDALSAISPRSGLYIISSSTIRSIRIILGIEITMIKHSSSVQSSSSSVVSPH